MKVIDEMIKMGEVKLKSKDGKKALAFLKEHKKELAGVGSDSLSKILAWVGLGEPEKAKELYMIKYQTKKELIDGMAKSGEIFKTAHEEMVKRGKEIDAMWRGIGEDAARALLPLLISLI